MGEQRHEGSEKLRSCVEADGIRYALRQRGGSVHNYLPKFGHCRRCMQIMTSSRQPVIQGENSPLEFTKASDKDNIAAKGGEIWCGLVA